VTINAWSDLDADSASSDVGVSLAVNVADLTTKATVSGTTRAFFGPGGDLEAPGLTIVRRWRLTMQLRDQRDPDLGLVASRS